MSDFWIVVSVFLLSSVKLAAGGIPLAIALNFSFMETIVITSAGGLIGTLAFVYLSEWLIRAWGIFFPRSKKARVFTKRNRMIVRVKNKFGLMGLSLLTPLFFSIPIGSFLAVRYYRNKGLIVAHMALSILLWSTCFSTVQLLF